MKEIKSAAYTMMGRRTRNQDNFLLGGNFLEEKHSSDYRSFSCKLDNLFFAAVVDGNGTKETGEAASRLVCDTFRKLHDSLEELNDLSEAGDLINAALFEANKVIEAMVENAPNSKMGATCALIIIYNDKAYYGNVGDSAVYMRRDGELKKLTTDHTEGEELIARGALTRDMLPNHSSKTKVTRMIGYLSFGRRDIMQFYDVMDVQNGDVFVLATPGIVQFMEAADIDKGLQTCIDVQKSAERVVKSAHADFESKDNITILIARISEETNSVGGGKVHKIKPARGGGVHLHTEVNVDPKAVLKGLYIAMIVVIFAIAFIYAYKAFPREQKLRHIDQGNYTWTDYNGGASSENNASDDKTEKDDDDEKSENNAAESEAEQSSPDADPDSSASTGNSSKKKGPKISTGKH